MNEAMVERIVRAVLYEGYILYPYRPSLKNRQRWSFGGVYPRAYGESLGGSSPSDSWLMQAQCLVGGNDDARLRATVRFLHLLDRKVERVVPSPGGEGPAFEPVESLEIAGRLLQSWQEAEEREIRLDEVALGELAARPHGRDFAFPHRRELELVRGSDGSVAGRVTREQQAVEGSVEVSAARKSPGTFAVAVRLSNRTPFGGRGPASRGEALLRSFASSHAVLGVRGGAFVSLTDPPDALRAAAADCRNVGCWPVLVGEAGERDTVLASPIILPDYPQVAPESPGDLFDATEIDEILTLRVMTLTDEEKRRAVAVDERAREMLARTEALAREQMMKLHGTMRR